MVRTGFLQYLDYGVGASTTAAVGKVSGGKWDDKANINFDGTIGGGHLRRPGMVAPTGNATFYPVAAGILAYAQRSNYTAPAMSALTFEGGTTSEAFRHQGAYINSLRLEGAFEATLKATIEWMALTPDDIAVPTWNARTTGNHYEWFGGTCTVGGQALSLQTATINLANNLRPVGSLDGKAEGTERFPDELVIGNEVVTASFGCYVPPGSGKRDEIYADEPDGTVVASLAFVNSAGGTFTIALASMTLESFSMPIVLPDDSAVFSLECVCPPNTSGALTMTVA